MDEPAYWSNTAAYEYGKGEHPLTYFKHSALGFQFERFGDTWGITINPALVYTRDGTKKAKSAGVKRHLLRARAQQFNNIYMNDVLFWTYLFSGGEDRFFVDIEGQSVLEISGRPVSLDAPFSIRVEEKASQ